MFRLHWGLCRQDMDAAELFAVYGYEYIIFWREGTEERCEDVYVYVYGSKLSWEQVLECSKKRI